MGDGSEYLSVERSAVLLYGVIGLQLISAVKLSFRGACLSRGRRGAVELSSVKLAAL